MIFGFPAGMLGIMVDGGADGIPPSASFLTTGSCLGDKHRMFSILEQHHVISDMKRAGNPSKGAAFEVVDFW